MIFMKKVFYLLAFDSNGEHPKSPIISRDLSMLADKAKEYLWDVIKFNSWEDRNDILQVAKDAYYEIRYRNYNGMDEYGEAPHDPFMKDDEIDFLGHWAVSTHEVYFYRKILNIDGVIL